MKKIQKCAFGATLDLNLTPYSYAAPAVASAVPYITSAVSAALPTLATIGQVAWPLLAVGGGTALGLYALANAENGAVSAAISAAAKRERQRHLAEAEAKWKEKNQHYADLINTYGSVQYPVGTFYNYDPTTGTAFLEKDLGNGLMGRWTQNMRTHEKGNPCVYDTATGEIYNGEMTGPNSAYVQMPSTTVRASPVEIVGYNSTPITLSNGRVVVLPSTLPVTDAVDLFNSKEQTESELQKGEIVLEDTPVPEYPNGQDDDWWKKLVKSFTDSFKRSSKAMGTGFANGADVTMKAIGYSLPPLIMLGIPAGLTYGGYKAGEHFGFWGDENQPEPVKQEQSEPTYDNANLKEMIKRQNERKSIDSLNNAR